MKLNLAIIARVRGDQERLEWAAHNVMKAERTQGKETEKSKQARELLASAAP